MISSSVLFECSFPRIAVVTLNRERPATRLTALHNVPSI